MEIKEIIENSNKIKELFSFVSEKCKKLKVTLRIYEKQKIQDCGQTRLVGVDLIIDLNEELDKDIDKKTAVLVHELGEALYIIKRIPALHTECDEKYLSYLKEIFTHQFINCLVKNKSMKNLLNPIRKSKLELDKISTIEAYKQVIIVCWELITHTESKKELLKIADELNIREYVENIINKILDIKFSSKKENIMIQMQEIIDDIKGYGMNEKIEIYENKLFEIMFMGNEIDLNFEIDIEDSVFYAIENNCRYSNIQIISNKIKVNKYFIEETKVRDVCRYDLVINRKVYPIISKKDDEIITDVSTIYQEKSVVIILESPHIKEYEEDKGSFKAISPANGKTGERIDKNLEIIINEIKSRFRYNFKQNTYKVIICNPVQYQASLYFLHSQSLSNSTYSRLRDDVWKKIFYKDNIRNDFERRIRMYNPEIVINACTKNLKDDVNRVIRALGNDVCIFNANHPIAWGDFNLNQFQK